SPPTGTNLASRIQSCRLVFSPRPTPAPSVGSSAREKGTSGSRRAQRRLSNLVQPLLVLRTRLLVVSSGRRQVHPHLRRRPAEEQRACQGKGGGLCGDFERGGVAKRGGAGGGATDAARENPARF